MSEDKKPAATVLSEDILVKGYQPLNPKPGGGAQGGHQPATTGESAPAKPPSDDSSGSKK